MPATSPNIRLPDRYQVTRRIASGGMATVYSAEDTLLGRLVAVKVLGVHFAADETARRRFQREARAAARVSDHPNVVTIYDIDTFDDQPFIVMEHFSGGTVADRLRSGAPIARDEALQWLDEAAAALDHAHRHGIVHRDVKPANLMLDEHGRLAVGDFGIARMASDVNVTQTGQVMGTAAYLSPEQALGHPATAASDRYALAVVAFELLTGSRPFTGEHVASVARAHVEAEPPAASESTPELPAAVDGVLWRGLEKDSDRRWPTAGAMVAALDDALEESGGALDATVPMRPLAAAADVPRTPPPRTPPPRTPPPGAAPAASGHRRVAPWVVLAAIVLVIGAGIAAFASRGGGDEGANAGTSSKRHTAASRQGAQRKRSRTATQQQAAAPATTAPAAQAPADQPTQPAAGGTDPSTLQAQGHQLLAQGSYDQAIAALQQAVQNCPVSQTDPCAYAYYDLGHALRLAGRPQEAIPVLQTRLQNGDQRGTVLSELQAALADAGQAGDGQQLGKAHGKHNGGKGKGGGGD